MSKVQLKFWTIKIEKTKLGKLSPGITNASWRILVEAETNFLNLECSP